MTLKTAALVAALAETLSTLMDLLAVIGSSALYAREPALFVPWGASLLTHLSLAVFFAMFYRDLGRPR